MTEKKLVEAYDASWVEAAKSINRVMGLSFLTLKLKMHDAITEAFKNASDNGNLLYAIETKPSDPGYDAFTWIAGNVVMTLDDSLVITITYPHDIGSRLCNRLELAQLIATEENWEDAVEWFLKLYVGNIGLYEDGTHRKKLLVDKKAIKDELRKRAAETTEEPTS